MIYHWNSIPVIFKSWSVFLAALLWISLLLVLKVDPWFVELLKRIVKVAIIHVNCLVYFWAFKNILFVLHLSVDFNEVVFDQVSWKQIDESVAGSAFIDFFSKSGPKTLLVWENVMFYQPFIDYESFFKVFFAVRGSTGDSHGCEVNPIQIGSKQFIKEEAFKGFFGSWEWLKFD